jgi:tyrosyl-DNA phosphodiesterase-1
MVPKREVIDLISDSEDEKDKKTSIKRKRVSEPPIPQSSQSSNKAAKAPTNPTSSQQPIQPPSSQASSFLSERAKLERERRERQKRLRPDVHANKNDNADDEDEHEDTGLREPPAKRQHLSSSGIGPNNGHYPFSSSISSQGISTIDQVFWDGELRQTANYHADPRGDGRPTFRLTEILGQVSPP